VFVYLLLAVDVDGTHHIMLLKVSLEESTDVPPKRRFTFNGLHGVISQKIEIFFSWDIL
jgi:hypothetical protein